MYIVTLAEKKEEIKTLNAARKLARDWARKDHDECREATVESNGEVVAAYRRMLAPEVWRVTKVKR